MELRDLKTFVAVARLQSFHRASETLHTAQSTISARIAILERDLGTRLFDRLGRKIVLTVPGQRLLEYAVRMVDLEDEARVWVCGNAESRGMLTVRIPESLCAYRMGGIIRSFRALFPNVALSFAACSAEGLDRDLRGGITDLAFLMTDSVQAKDLQIETLGVENLVLVCGPGHRLADRADVVMEDLRSETIVLSKADCSYRRMFESMLDEAGIETAPGLEFSSSAALRGCVMQGVGITLLPELAVREEAARGQMIVLPWRGPVLETAVLMLHHREKWLSPPLLAFMALTRQDLMSGTSVPDLAPQLRDESGNNKRCC